GRGRVLNRAPREGDDRHAAIRAASPRLVAARSRTDDTTRGARGGEGSTVRTGSSGERRGFRRGGTLGRRGVADARADPTSAGHCACRLRALPWSGGLANIPGDLHT